MDNTQNMFLTNEEWKFLSNYFFSFWGNLQKTDIEIVKELVAVTSLSDLKTLLRLIHTFIHYEIPEQEKSKLLISNIKSDFSNEYSLTWMKHVFQLIKVEHESKEILTNAENSVVNSMRDKVAWLLNRYPETRDSDITLQLYYWGQFESGFSNGETIKISNLYQFARLTSITRERARIQNQYHLFNGTKKVSKKRKEMEEEARDLAIQDKPTHPIITVYLDETGTTQKYLIIGGVCFLTRIAYSDFFNEVKKLRSERHFNGEFHFNKLTSATLTTYKGIVDIFSKFTSVVTFIYIVVEKSKTSKSIQEAKEELYYHLLVEGIQQEIQAGRVSLPKKLLVWIDPEEAIADRLTIQNLKERLIQACKVSFDNQLEIDKIFMDDSKNNLFLQIADLFIGSINRVLNNPSTSEKNQKDFFAKYFLDKIGINQAKLENERPLDMINIIRL